jgi:hypothetical protein
MTIFVNAPVILLDEKSTDSDALPCIEPFPRSLARTRPSTGA